jgi:hypothetical protein
LKSNCLCFAPKYISELRNFEEFFKPCLLKTDCDYAVTMYDAYFPSNTSIYMGRLTRTINKQVKKQNKINEQMMIIFSDPVLCIISTGT